MVHLLIDGYNLLHLLDPRSFQSLEERRDDLLEQLHQYREVKNVPITIVFDGAGPSLSSSRESWGHVDVVYTPESETADDWIIRECSHHPAKYLVVSNDRQVQIGSERFQCLALSSDEFLRRLKSALLQLGPSRGISYNPIDLDEVKDDSGPLYPRITTKKKGAAKKPPKRERRKLNRLKNL